MNTKQYRGLTKDGSWMYGGLYELPNGMAFIVTNNPFPPSSWSFNIGIFFVSLIEVIPETVGQSIVVEGKEFYEGDVTKDDVGDLGVVRFGKLPLDKSGDCVCRYPAFYLRCFGQLGQAPTYECQQLGEWMEIIGTIHTTHPELLEKQ